MSQKQELIKFVENFDGKCGYGFRSEEALHAAQEQKLCDSFSFVEDGEQGPRKWGYDVEKIFKVDDYYVLIDVYVMTGDGENELNEIYEVESYEEVITKWRMKK